MTTNHSKQSVLSMLRPAGVLLGIFTLITGLAYPLLTTGVAHIVFPEKAQGSLIKRNDVVIGSRLIGQEFTSPQYLWGRPSATPKTPYNAAGSAGSNAGPMNDDLHAAVFARATRLRQSNPTQTQDVPVDLVTSSASGLDPHISVAAARYQIDRIAAARNSSRDAVLQIIDANTTQPLLGIFGEPVVNVLEVNLALDSAK